MKNKILEWPLAQIRDDGMPAVWLTHTTWLLLRPGLVGKYLDNRESMGRVKARAEQKRSEAHDVCGHFDKEFARAALEMYRAGYEAYHHVAVRCESLETSPEELVELGDKREAHGYEDQTKLLQASARLDLAAA